jgi:3-hydroxybutyryl-CoA dehydrogenase
MGSGIAQVCSQVGYRVVVSEVDDGILDRGLASINSALVKDVENGKMSLRDKDNVMARIKGTTSMQDFSDCDLVIEAVLENLNLKKKTFAELDRVCPGHAILATNTSCLSVMDIAAQTNRPDRVLGTHFFYPAPLMTLLEIVRTIATSDETLQASKLFGESLGKTVVIARDTPGFVVNRLLVPYCLAAVRMLEAGLATREDIDNGVRLGLNYPMGPLTLMDFTGLDTWTSVADAVYEETKDPAWVVPILLRKMVAVGWHGRKTRKGFYEYR